MRSDDGGRQVVLDRLADVLLVMVLRHVAHASGRDPAADKRIRGIGPGEVRRVAGLDALSIHYPAVEESSS